ncbi:MAG: NADAR family protein [Myxococcota bacterium]
MDLEQLRREVRAGATFDYLFFWGHRQKRKGGADASCLSQWFPASFVINGTIYPTAEHWMMAGKARLFGDNDMLQKILAADEPGKAKAFGRRVRNYEDEAWAEARYGLVVEGNVEKFSQNASLRTFLCNTGKRVLVEASPKDDIWGIGLAASDADASDPLKWRGTNLLGFALMEARERILSAT